MTNADVEKSKKKNNTKKESYTEVNNYKKEISIGEEVLKKIYTGIWEGRIEPGVDWLDYLSVRGESVTDRLARS